MNVVVILSWACRGGRSSNEHHIGWVNAITHPAAVIVFFTCHDVVDLWFAVVVVIPVVVVYTVRRVITVLTAVVKRVLTNWWGWSASSRLLQLPILKLSLPNRTSGEELSLSEDASETQWND